MLFAVLAFDVAGYCGGVIPALFAAVIALIIGLIALVVPYAPANVRQRL